MEPGRGEVGHYIDRCISEVYMFHVVGMPYSSCIVHVRIHVRVDPVVELAVY
jgi:hypothetical protein